LLFQLKHRSIAEKRFGCSGMLVSDDSESGLLGGGDHQQRRTEMDMPFGNASSLLFQEYLRGGAEFEFLGHLSTEKTGGLHKVRSLWSCAKVWRFAVLWFLIIINVSSIMDADLNVLEDASALYNLKHHTAQAWERLRPHLSDEIRIYEYSSSRSVGQPFVYASILVSALDLLLVAGLVARAWYYALVYQCYKAKPESSFYAWRAIFNVFQQGLQPLSSVSSLWVLRYVHPELMEEQFEEWMLDFANPNSRVSKAAAIAAFVIIRLFCLGFGTLAFTVKLANVGLHLTQERFWVSKHGDPPVFLVLAFIDQVLGITDLDQVMQDRVFSFVFGGAKGEMEVDDRALKSAYLAAVMQRICSEFREGLCNKLKAVILMSTFNHLDLQMLVLREDMAKKLSTTSSVFSSRCSL